MDSQNETPNFVSLLDGTDNETFMETSNASYHNINPYFYGTQISRELPEESPSQLDSSRKPKPRLPNFTVEEDLALISSWLAISQDPVQSNDQKLDQFWARIHDYYHAHRTFESQRSRGSLMQRWSTIQLQCNKYSGCLAKIESMHSSGMTEENKIDSAKQMYKETHPKKQKFVFEHCWNVLKYAPKWINSHENETTRKRRGEISSIYPINLEDEDIANDDLERPLGKKAEKARLKKQKCTEGSSSNMESILNAMVEEKRKTNVVRMEFLEKGRADFIEMENRRLCIEEEKLELAKRQEERQRMKEEMEIISKDLDTLSPVQQEYF